MTLLSCFFACWIGMMLLGISAFMERYGKRYQITVAPTEKGIVAVCWCFCGYLLFYFNGNVDYHSFIIKSYLLISQKSALINYLEYLLLLSLACFFWILIAWIDFRTKRIPNELNLAILILGLLLCLLQIRSSEIIPISWKDQIGGMLILSLPMCIVNRCYPGGFGGGDVKLLAVSGFFLGWSLLLQASLMGTCFSAVACLFLLIVKKISRKETIAFGPYLCLGMIIVVLKLK